MDMPGLWFAHDHEALEEQSARSRRADVTTINCGARDMHEPGLQEQQPTAAHLRLGCSRPVRVIRHTHALTTDK